jgi:hypothetical protein
MFETFQKPEIPYEHSNRHINGFMLLGVAAGTAFADMLGETDIWLAARNKTFSCITLQVEMPSGTISIRNTSIKRGKNL